MNPLTVIEASTNTKRINHLKFVYFEHLTFPVVPTTISALIEEMIFISSMKTPRHLRNDKIISSMKALNFRSTTPKLDATFIPTLYRRNIKITTWLPWNLVSITSRDMKSEFANTMAFSPAPPLHHNFHMRIQYCIMLVLEHIHDPKRKGHFEFAVSIIYSRFKGQQNHAYVCCCNSIQTHTSIQQKNPKPQASSPITVLGIFL